MSIAYEFLIKYLLKIKFYFKKHKEKYFCENIGCGYLHTTYFPFFNINLIKNDLCFGFGLNH
ncbi:DUF7000 family protein [Lactobacillus sp. B4007]|uniref:DUF7000 family protein n=1 Tax=Lactobacillus sp. B4007 TaxID=2818032 RepID=UPI003A5D0780